MMSHTATRLTSGIFLYTPACTLPMLPSPTIPTLIMPEKHLRDAEKLNCRALPGFSLNVERSMLSCVGRSRHRRENPAMRQTTTRTVCLILCLAGSGRAALVTNLGAFPGAIQSVATDVNNAGTVGGFSQHSTGIAMRPFRWTAETGLVQFDSAEGRPTAIDNSGMMI